MDGFNIPIGADFSVMQQATERIIAAMDQMGARIAAALEKSNAATISAATSLARMEGGASRLTNSANASGAAVASMSTKFAQAAQRAGAVGHTIGGLTEGMRALNSISRVLTGVNLAQKIGAWSQAGGSLRVSLSKIPTVMKAIASNRTFQVIAVGAAAAYAAVLTVRTACRVVSASIKTLRTAATTVFNGMIASARAAASAVAASFRGIGSLPGKVMGTMPGLPVAGLLSAAGVIGFAFSSINKAAEMEQLQTAFAPLLGGADAAKKRIEELAKFAADTPFEIPQVVAASRVLETLTRGALSTGKGLTMVGDIASGVNQPFDEIAVTVGRLYDGLDSGRPVGEALMRLQELGVISGETRGKIEKLQEEGKKGEQVWGIAANAFSRFAGSSERQSKTFTGKLSNLSDAVSRLMAKFGEPIIDALKPWVDKAIGYVDSIQAKIAGIGASIGNAFNAAMAVWQVGDIAGVVGAGLTLAIIDGINAFSSGIRATMAYLSGAMSEIMKSAKDSWGAQEFLGILMDVGKGIAAMITAAILKGLDAIPGIDASQQTASATNEGKNSFNRAKNRLQDFDGADAAQKGIEALKRADAAGRNAAANSDNKEPLIDNTKALFNFAEKWVPVKDQIQKNLDGITKANAELDAKLKGKAAPTPGEGMADKVNKAAAPAVLSLTRIGGGGFANTVAQSQLGESRKHTALLQQLVSKLKQNPENKPYKAQFA